MNIISNIENRTTEPEHMTGKVAVVTGVTGQDGSYLSQFLLELGYSVYGVVRRTSQPQSGRALISHLLDSPNFNIVSGDLSDQGSLENIVRTTKPDEFYNLGAQSFVPESWISPIHTADVTGLGTLRCLEAIRIHAPECRFYQAGSSEQFGKVLEVPQNEETPFYPRSPYGCAKVFAFEITRNYRESHSLYACTGILFNHESPRRGIEFVTRKVSLSAARIKHRVQKTLEIGNVEAKRDWGFAGDYVQMMWKMLQNEKPDDYVISTGETHTVRDMIDVAFERIGMPLTWNGEGVGKYAVDEEGVKRVVTNERFFRPAEVDVLIGDPKKAIEDMGWKPVVGFEELIQMMVDSDDELVDNAIKKGEEVPIPMF
jgi:GDPmannose 4,6-dehydratase